MLEWTAFGSEKLRKEWSKKEGVGEGEKNVENVFLTREERAREHCKSMMSRNAFSRSV